MAGCSEEQLLSPYLDGELAPDERTRLEQHLRQCRTCAIELERLASASRRLREYPAPQLTERERIELHKAVDDAAAQRVWRFGLTLGVIAASVLILGIAWLNAIPPRQAQTVASAPPRAPAPAWERTAMTLRADPLPHRFDEPIVPDIQLAEARVVDWMLEALAEGLPE